MTPARITLGMISETDPSWKMERAENYIDTSMMNRLEAKGFLDALQREFAAK